MFFVIVGFNYNLAERPHRKCRLTYLVPEEDLQRASGVFEGDPLSFSPLDINTSRVLDHYCDHIDLTLVFKVRDQ